MEAWRGGGVKGRGEMERWRGGGRRMKGWRGGKMEG